MNEKILKFNAETVVEKSKQNYAKTVMPTEVEKYIKSK